MWFHRLIIHSVRRRRVARSPYARVPCACAFPHGRRRAVWNIGFAARFCKPASHHSYRPRTTRSTVSGPTYCRCHSSQKHIVIHVQTERSGCSECVTAPSDRSTSAGPECGDARRACYTSRCTACRHTTNDIQLTVLFTFSIHNSDSTSRCLKSANPKSEIQEARRYSRSGRGIFISSLI